ncbi:F-box domain-containing protein [Orpheovirus IHUMI-LCC2]|uniref:F-box domain-containing protein n=1 Tax=Orpheovirus IHUMI-LCC2 TaxID=2023057 RepID=A0A2I2L3C3_9VIRU|nr:F-box domain-containing protein [Orpheovirus IHUMI-LCC2]SNW62010.1 F-box domain-containing protein [Orpheovirus IHUMI-LCC2]
MEGLPTDINSELFSLLDIDTIMKLSKTNKQWNIISKDRRYWLNYINIVHGDRYVIDIPVVNNYIEWYYNFINKYNPQYNIYIKINVYENITYGDMAKIVYDSAGYDKEILGFDVNNIYYKDNNNYITLYYKFNNDSKISINEFNNRYKDLFGNNIIKLNENMDINVNVDWIVTDKTLALKSLSNHIINRDKVGNDDIYYVDVAISYTFDDNSEFIYEEFFNDMDSYDFNNMRN